MEELFVLIDMENRAIRLFGDQNRVIPFKFAFTLPSIISGRQVSYVTSIEQVNGEDVVNLLTTIIDESDASTEPLYFRSKQEGYVRIPEIPQLKFSGPKDAKPFSVWGYDIFDRSPTLRKLLSDGKVEILTESEKIALRKHKLDPKAKDKALDSILLGEGKSHFVKDIMENEEMFGLGGGTGDEIDPEQEVLTDAEQIVREHKIGKDRNV